MKLEDLVLPGTFNIGQGQFEHGFGDRVVTALARGRVEADQPSGGTVFRPDGDCWIGPVAGMWVRLVDPRRLPFTKFELSLVCLGRSCHRAQQQPEA